MGGPLDALHTLDRAQREGLPHRLAVLDYRFEGMEGGELARMIQERPALGNLAIVLLTASLADGHEASQAGVAHHLPKPPSPSQLYNAIAAAVGAFSHQPFHIPAAELRSSAVHGADGALVLIAEDDKVNQLVASAMLEKRGYRVHVAGNGAEAVRMSAAQEYAAIFMDCQMPELDGYEATARIRARDSGNHTPIIATTANSMIDDGDRCLAAGMDDYLPKPIQGSELDRVLQHWLVNCAGAYGEVMAAAP